MKAGLKKVRLYVLIGENRVVLCSLVLTYYKHVTDKKAGNTGRALAQALSAAQQKRLVIYLAIILADRETDRMINRSN